ncbi:hypothetical protein [Nostoc sp. 'Peltigera malacea cyanobiont' DB3992]|uniref:hypothetical protein n=1 Tax=Nostoc sp. 'Peltigera malacea cyanobiont' DB3992 TaxID=1206980 RepID=UPI000C03AC8C|nr:hypothetical protein [Nostoc sp. 'Peltigera malacea cyanobiont' DB3992]PHM08034.1 hypothetical protein CK516_23305 [Nostoc sp. 'Peltigera malacea cyanobiont' DB3992]
MDFYKQLELFDLRLYTSKHFTANDGEEKQFEEVPQPIEYEQLELDLFPELTCLIPIKLMKLAA